MDDETLTHQDLFHVRTEIERHFESTAERIEALESRSAAGTRVIANAMRSVVFLVGSYSFLNHETGVALRYVVNEITGDEIVGGDGEPLMSPMGTGAIVEIFFTGTAFVVTSDGKLLTNRHVARPWETDSSLHAVMAQHGLVPTLKRFVGYVPEFDQPFKVSLIGASDKAD